MEFSLLFNPAPWKRGSVLQSLILQPGIWLPMLGLHLIVIWWQGRKNGAPLLFWHQDPVVALVSGVVVALTIGFFIFVFFILDYSAWAGPIKKKRESSGEKTSSTEFEIEHWSEKASEYFDQCCLEVATDQAKSDDQAVQNFGVELRRQSFIFKSLTDAFAMLIAGLFLFRLLLSFIFIFRSGSIASQGKFDTWSESIRFSDPAWWLFILGMILGALIIALVNALKFYFIPGINKVKLGRPIPILHRFDKRLVWSQETATIAYGFWAVSIVFISHIVFWWLGEVMQMHFAAASICVMLAWVVAVYGSFVFILRRDYPFKVWALAFTALLLVTIPALHFLDHRYGFRNLQVNDSEDKTLSPIRTVFPARPNGLIEPESVQLEKAKRKDQELKERVEAGQFWPAADGAPGNESAKWGDGPLVVICASGGGITAEAWVAQLLELFGSKLDGFNRNVRLITGSSGGMVGAAAWVGYQFDRYENQPQPSKPLQLRCQEDQLSPAAVRFALVDANVIGFIAQRFGDSRLLGDRGEVLEETWYSPESKTGVLPELRLTLEELRTRETRSEVPSIIFSPTIAQQGRGLLISNLDVTRLTTQVLPGQDEMRQDRIHRFVSGRELIGPTGIAKTPLTTWARMSATFPLVSPPGCLRFKNTDPVTGEPVEGHVHVVDAAYSDNQGTSLALAWLRNYWLPWARTGSPDAPRDVILIEMDAFPRYGQSAWGLTPNSPSRLVNGYRAAIEDIHVPLVGVNNRPKRHIYNTGRLLAEFGEDLQKEGFSFSSYRFVNPIPASMSWYLSRQEQLGLKWFASIFAGLDGIDPSDRQKESEEIEALIKKANEKSGLSKAPVATDDGFLIYSLREYQELLAVWRSLTGKP